MAITIKFALLLLVALSFSGHVLARGVTTRDDTHRRLGSLALTSIGECWTAMMELRSCTDEIILFLLNGESYLGKDCCRAIRVITWHCWPSMLSTLGFTPEEGDILKGYCDATISFPPPPPSPPPPPPSSTPVLAPSPSVV